MSRIKFCLITMALFIFSFGTPVCSISEIISHDLKGSSGRVQYEGLLAAYQKPEPTAEMATGKNTLPPRNVKKTEPSVITEKSLTPLDAVQDELDADGERDIMEEALALLEESQTYWVKGNLENALDMLDQSYALLLDANGNQDTARQKDDLRLMISKRILAIYNSIQTPTKGKSSEIPLVTNADVEKEIRLFQTVERDFFMSSFQRSKIYRPIILRELKKAGLPEELSWLPLVESGFKITALSSARALGLWQFIPSTGYKYGLNRDDWIDERMDIEKSTRAAIDYLKDLHNMFGDWLTVLAGYNCGEGRVMRTIASQHINYLDRFWDLYQKLPNETARYVPRFLATLQIIKNPQKYGMDLGSGMEKASVQSYEVVEVNKSMKLQDIAQKLETPEEPLNILNAELRHRQTPDRPYKLKVPIEKAEVLVKVIDDIPQMERPRFSSASIRGISIRHKVRQGETIENIAKKYNTSVAVIRASNNLTKKQQISAGQRIHVPMQVTKRVDSPSKVQKGEKSVKHVVKKGDTLAALARKYETTISEIKKTNHLKADKLKSGQVITIQRDNDEADQAGRVKETAKKAKAAPRKAEVKGNAAPPEKRYTVKKGDTLSKIARENNVSLVKLQEINKLTNKGSIRPGQVILIK